MTKQKALLLVEKQGSFAVRDIDVIAPGPGELLVKVHSAGLNPGDWKVAETGLFIAKYPAVLGFDVAGTVEVVGEDVVGFAVGDRVFFEGTFDTRGGAFQQFSITSADVAAKIPENLSFDEAATLPVAVATGIFGFYRAPAPQLGGAGLTPFWAEGGRGKYAGKPVVVIGGSSAVGQQAIQVARLSGFSPIITTASAHNTKYLQSLGATHVIDRSASLSDAVEAATSQPVAYVFDAISHPETQSAAWKVLAPGGTLILVNPVARDEEGFEKGESEGRSVVRVFGVSWEPTQKPLGVEMYKHLTAALENGDLKPNQVEVLPDGLAGIPGGLERLKLGKVSATKLVARPLETA